MTTGDIGLRRVRRALLSVSDKTGLVGFARALASHGVELISTGGTARELAGAGLAVTPVESLTGMPEMLSGRVKTLHPAIHGGILAIVEDSTHAAALRTHGIEPIDLVCVNLYPFEETVERLGRARGTGDEAGDAGDEEGGRAEAIEMIDIGGPAMVRSAAKNAERVAAVTDPAEYASVLEDLRAHGGTTAALRRRLQAEAFARTAAYDAAIADWLRRGVPIDPADDALPARIVLCGRRVGELRYGENPHQAGAAYVDASGAGPASVLRAEHLHGKALSANNLLDADAALSAIGLLALVAPGAHAAVVIKHTNPCGLATGPRLDVALADALAGDPLAAFGGIVAVSSVVDGRTAERLCEDSAFLEVLIAPGFEAAALDRLRARWANLRILRVPGDRVPRAVPGLEARAIGGGWLVQQRDLDWPGPSSWTHAAGPMPSAEQLRAAAVLEVAAARLSSNAVVIGGPVGAGGPGAGGAGDGGAAMFGAGSGLVDRVSACHMAVRKAGARAEGAVAVSDAFFPFPDGPELLIRAGVRMLVHPGGSRRDNETFALCERSGVVCMVTGRRRFRH